jgi:hypothetical protein
MYKLTKPDDLQPQTSAVEVIVNKLELEFAKPDGRRFDKPIDNTSIYQYKTVHINGQFELADCKEVCALYEQNGWDKVSHRKVPYNGRGEKETTFTFRKIKK